MEQRIRQRGNAAVVVTALVLAMGLCVGGYFLVVKSDSSEVAVNEPSEAEGAVDVTGTGDGEAVEGVETAIESETKKSSNLAPRKHTAETVEIETPEVPDDEELNVHIRGKVIAHSGDPIEGVQLRWIDASHRDLKDLRHDPRLLSGELPSSHVTAELAGSMGQSRVVKTKEDGSFEIRVPVQDGVVIASAEGYCTVIKDLEGDEGGGGFDLGELSAMREEIESAIESGDSASAIAKAKELAGETHEVVVTLDFELTGAALVSGRVVDEDTGAPASGMTVVLMKRKPGAAGGAFARMMGGIGGDKGHPSAVVDSAGNFTIVGVRAGEYDVLPKTGRSDYVGLPSKKAQRVTLRSGDEVTGLEFKVTLGGVITGIVTDLDGARVSEAKIMAMPNVTGLDFMSGDLDIFSMFEERNDIKTGKDGSYTVTALPLDQEYQVSANHPEFAGTKGDLVTLSKEKRKVQVDIALLRGSTVSGFVYYEDGSPAPEASVNLMPDMTEIISGGGISSIAIMADGNNHARTNEEGFFEFANVAPGNYTVQSGNDYDFSPFGKGKGVEIEVDGETDIADIELTIKKDTGKDVPQGPAGTLVGRVVDDEGEPIAGANLNFWGMDGSGSGTSDDDGSFSVDITGNGPFTASIVHSGYTALNEGGIKPSDSEIVLTLHRLAGVSGRVTTSDGESAEGGRVVVRPIVEDMSGFQRMFSFGESGGSADLAPDGSYYIDGVPNGLVEIVAHVPGYAPGASEQLEISGGEQISDVNIQVSPGATLTGKVKATDSPALEGATVRLLRDTGNKNLEMFAQMMPAFFEGDGGKAVTAKNGRYEINHLAPGKYKLTVSHEDYAPSAPQPIEIGSQREVRAKEIELAPGGSIEGVVLHGAERTPIAGVTIQVFGEGPMKMAQTGPDGSFKFEGLPFGEYMVNATQMTSGNFMPKTKTVQIEGTAPTRVEVLFGVGVKITGKVEGLESGFQQILLRPLDAPKLEDLDLSDMSGIMEAAKHNVAQGMVFGGEYTLEGIEPGTYYIEIPAMPDDPSDLEAYMKMDRTPHYRKSITVGKEDLTHDIRIIK